MSHTYSLFLSVLASLFFLVCFSLFVLVLCVSVVAFPNCVIVGSYNSACTLDLSTMLWFFDFTNAL